MLIIGKTDCFANPPIELHESPTWRHDCNRGKIWHNVMYFTYDTTALGDALRIWKFHIVLHNLGIRSCRLRAYFCVESVLFADNVDCYYKKF